MLLVFHIFDELINVRLGGQSRLGPFGGLFLFALLDHASCFDKPSLVLLEVFDYLENLLVFLDLGQ
jgi:hypothetical protein